MSSGMSKTQKVIWDLWCQKHPLLSLQGLQMREKPAGFRMRSRCKCRKLPLRAGVWGVLQSPSPRWGAWSRGCGWPTPPTCKRRAACASGQRGVLRKAGSSARWGHERWGWGMAMFLVPHAPQRSPPAPALAGCQCSGLGTRWVQRQAESRDGCGERGAWEYAQPWCSESSKKAGAKELLCCDWKIEFCSLGILESALVLLLRAKKKKKKRELPRLYGIIAFTIYVKWVRCFSDFVAWW